MEILFLTIETCTCSTSLSAFSRHQSFLVKCRTGKSLTNLQAQKCCIHLNVNSDHRRLPAPSTGTMASSQTDIIDLTVESPPVTQLPQDSEPEPESGEIDVKEPKLESETRKSRKRKKKRKSITADTAESRKQPRDDATDRGEGPSRTRESPSKRSKRSPTPTADDGDFYVDLTPALQSTSSQRAVPAFSTSELPPDEETKLILPSHVQVFGSLPVEIIPASQENEDFIDYLDYDSNSRKVCTLKYSRVRPLIDTRASLDTIKTQTRNLSRQKACAKIVVRKESIQHSTARSSSSVHHQPI